MDQKTLTAAARPERKTGASRRLRRDGKIPAVIYGHREPIAVSLDATEFGREFRVISESQIIQLHVDGETYDVLIKDYQEDILTGDILHLDFFEIEAGKSLRTHIAIHVHGTSAGVREGGILEQPLHEVEIECLPKDIPDAFDLDVSGLNIGDSLHVSDLPVQDGVSVLTNEDSVIALVTMPRLEVEGPEEGEETLEGVMAASGEGAGEEGEAESGEEGSSEEE
ncbi:MAG: 50S ribosomal protein L25 [Spirochaetales bacterium]